jgi:hypothetical protein
MSGREVDTADSSIAATKIEIIKAKNIIQNRAPRLGFASTSAASDEAFS